MPGAAPVTVPQKSTNTMVETNVRDEKRRPIAATQNNNSNNNTSPTTTQELPKWPGVLSEGSTNYREVVPWKYLPR